MITIALGIVLGAIILTFLPVILVGAAVLVYVLFLVGASLLGACVAFAVLHAFGVPFTGCVVGAFCGFGLTIAGLTAEKIDKVASTEPSAPREPWKIELAIGWFGENVLMPFVDGVLIGIVPTGLAVALIDKMGGNAAFGVLILPITIAVRYALKIASKQEKNAN